MLRTGHNQALCGLPFTKLHYKCHLGLQYESDFYLSEFIQRQNSIYGFQSKLNNSALRMGQIFYGRETVKPYVAYHFETV